MLTMRPHRGPADLDHMLDVVQSLPNGDDEYPASGDLRERFVQGQDGDARDDTRLWADDAGCVLGFAFVALPSCNLYWKFRAGVLNDAIGGAVVAWAAEHVGAWGRAQGQAVGVDAFAREDDADKIALLQRLGFTPTDEYMLRMVRSLDEPISAPQLPPGFTVRPVAGEHEVELYVALHRDAFGTHNMTVEHRLAIMRDPLYQPALDWVALAPDDTFAAFCIASINQAANRKSGRNAGEIDVVGTRRAFQGQGLGCAMLLVGLRQLQAHGINTAFLGTAGDNPAQRLYQSVGFRTLHTIRWYRRPV